MMPEGTPPLLAVLTKVKGDKVVSGRVFLIYANQQC